MGENSLAEGRWNTIAHAKDALRVLLQKCAPLLFRRVSAFHLTEDRKLLELVILTYLRDAPDVKRILFVGCEWYTKPYERLFRSKEYWTLEIDPRKRRYGASRHVVDALKNLELHVRACHFDAIVCNGVFMKTAIETREEAELSFDTCRRCLRSGGWFVLGWNDTDDLRPYSPSESPGLAKFERAEFPPLGVSEYLSDTSYRHTYTFYKRPSCSGFRLC
jgi:SAM-dependent methyltransferase